MVYTSFLFTRINSNVLSIKNVANNQPFALGTKLGCCILYPISTYSDMQFKTKINFESLTCLQVLISLPIQLRIVQNYHYKK